MNVAGGPGARSRPVDVKVDVPATFVVEIRVPVRVKPAGAEYARTWRAFLSERSMEMFCAQARDSLLSISTCA
mgnify:CR=1 FL=1